MKMRIACRDFLVIFKIKYCDGCDTDEERGQEHNNDNKRRTKDKRLVNTRC